MIQVPPVGKIVSSMTSLCRLATPAKPDLGSSIFQWLSLPQQFSMRAESIDNALMRERDRNSARLKRQNEFEVGRKCAGYAMQELGLTGPVLINADRSPAWPDGVVGSISHSSMITWAAVASTQTAKSVGIDTEPLIDTNVLASIKDQIVSDDEWTAARASLTQLSDSALFTAIFSAKEAFYKCLHQVEKEYFDFRDATATVVSDREMFLQTQLGENKNDRDCQRVSTPKSLPVFFEFSESSVFSITWIEAGELAWN